ncbi:unnamed protein product [Caenorhabditis brenneri]
MLGWGQYIGIPSWFLLYLIQALVSVFASAAIALLENRQNALQTKWKIRRKWIRIAINFLNYNVACVTVIPPYLETFDVEVMALGILKTIPCPVKEFFDPRLFFVTNKPFLATMLMATQSIILLPQGQFYVLHTWYHLVYAHSSRVSAETRRMQLRFLIGSLAQILIPTTVFMNPILYIWYSVNTGHYNQGW